MIKAVPRGMAFFINRYRQIIATRITMKAIFWIFPLQKL